VFYGHHQRFSLKTPLSNSLHLSTEHVNLQCTSSLSKVKSYYCNRSNLALKMEATCSHETSVDFQRTTRSYIPEDWNLHNHRCENLKSYHFKYSWSNALTQYSLQHWMKRTELTDITWLFSDPFNRKNYVMDFSHFDHTFFPQHHNCASSLRGKHVYRCLEEKMDRS
jgi:hypothetical protein